ncbi:MAG: serine/threonine-protein kinase [Nannocystaceae bacterium]
MKERVRARDSEPGAIGHYVVIDRLGRGGMGTVLRAFDRELGRPVALKLLHAHLSQLASDRLRREARAMAKLSHPNVVQVYEVGEAEGRVFVAMELVEGPTVAEWIEREPRAGWRECVDLFDQLGRGLAAAHEQGMIHRDFKPSNAIIDDKGRPRVLDFGLARLATNDAATSEGEPPRETVEDRALLERDESESMATPLTETGTVMGTPAYMAPEQSLAKAVDHRSDQYAFCISLWQALTGARPFRATDYAELLEAKLAGPPPWPSDAPAVPRRLVEALRRGLSAEPEQRWPSMEALLEQLRPPAVSRARSRIALGVAIAITGAGGSWAFGHYVQTKDLCTGAEAKLEGIWDDARRQEVEAALLGTGLSYAPETWAYVEPRLSAYAQGWARAHAEACAATTVRGELSSEVMDLRMACLDERRSALRANVEVLASADATVVENAAALSAGLPELARCDDLEALRASVPPPDDAGTAAEVEALREHLQDLRAQQQAGRYAAALEVAEPVVAEAEALGYAPLLAEAVLRRGELRQAAGQYLEAEDDLRRAYTLAVEHRHDEVSIDAASSLMLVVGHHRAKPDQGRIWADTALSLARRSGDDRKLATALDNLSHVLSIQGDYEQSRVQAERAYRLLETIFEPDHPELARSMSTLGLAFSRLGQHEQAKLYVERALRLREDALGPNHPEVASGLVQLGNIFRELGDYESAKPYLERAYRLQRTLLGPDHPQAARALGHLCSALTSGGEYEAAKDCMERAQESLEKAFGLDHPATSSNLNNLGVLHIRLGQEEQARRYFERALEVDERVLGPEHPELATGLSNLGNFLFQQENYEEAEPLLERALRIREEALGLDHPKLAHLLITLGLVVHWQGEFGRGRTHFARALRIQDKELGPDHPDQAIALSGLGYGWLRQGEHAEARECFERALRIMEAAVGPESPELGSSVRDLGTALRHQGRRESAKRHWERALRLWEAAGDVHVADRADVLTELAKLALEEKDFAAARARAERAVSLREGAAAKPRSLATSRFVLARALWPDPAERTRARRLAEQARDVLAVLDARALDEDLLGELERWLRRHPAP